MANMSKNGTTGKYELNITPSASAQTKTLKVGGTYCDADIVVNVDAAPPSETTELIVSSAGTFTPSSPYVGYNKVVVGAGTITPNTSGGSSSGTINRGSQIKVGKGYYSSDIYYTAQSNSGTMPTTITANGTYGCDGYVNVTVSIPIFSKTFTIG